MDAFGCGDFPRIRIGIGRPGAQVDVTDHVLGKFFPENSRSPARPQKRFGCSNIDYK
jgi:peptidyl-tRNA hydrolase